MFCLFIIMNPGGGGPNSNGNSSTGGAIKKMLKGKSFVSRMMLNLNDNIMNINNSKLFAGLMIITLNIASKFVTFKLGKTTENYLKYTFSKQILVFAIAWMGTRDIYIAIGLTLIFIFIFDILLNENSMFCIVPSKYHEYYSNLETTQSVSQEDYIKAKTTVENYEKQKEQEENKE